MQDVHQSQGQTRFHGALSSHMDIQDDNSDHRHLCVLGQVSTTRESFCKCQAKAHIGHITKRNKEALYTTNTNVFERSNYEVLYK